MGIDLEAPVTTIIAQPTTPLELPDKISGQATVNKDQNACELPLFFVYFLNETTKGDGFNKGMVLCS